MVRDWRKLVSIMGPRIIARMKGPGSYLFFSNIKDDAEQNHNQKLIEIVVHTVNPDEAEYNDERKEEPERI